MGCATSKLDDLPAVSLCRDRCAYLDEAIRQRYAFAEAHLAYLHALKSVGLSLDRYFNQDLEPSFQDTLSPVLNLPAERKGDPSDSPSDKIHHLHSHSDSGSHLRFRSDDSDDDNGFALDALHQHDVTSPARHHMYGSYVPGYENINFPGEAGGGGGLTNINYMKNQATPPVLYSQRPMSPKSVHTGESMSSSSSYFSDNISNNNNKYPPPSYNTNFGYNYNLNGDQNHPNYASGDGFFSSSSPPAPYDGDLLSMPRATAGSASSSKAPKIPPSPPRSSGWDFLNPFESYEKHHPPYTPSHDSREVREEEGIPDLEEDGNDVVKGIHGNQKFVDSGSSSYSKPEVSGGAGEEEDGRAVNDAQLQHNRARLSVGMESGPVEYEVHMADKKAVDSEVRSNDRDNTAGFKARGGFKGNLEVVREIQIQFERASECGMELAKFLEVGKLPCEGKHGGHHVSSKIFHFPVLSTSHPSTTKSSGHTDPGALDVDEDVELRSRNPSSTLYKLYLWEKKLHEEVKVEEKMRVLHERKSQKLKCLDERGADFHKIDTIRTFVRSLSTEIKIAIHVVDKISMKINSLRDEDLWPQLNEFILGLTRMWKSMLECHHNQCQAIGVARRLDAIAFHKHFSDTHFEATRELQHDLINWTLRFLCWVGTQKGFVRALNNWLMKCLLHIPEETPDGIVPFSPGRIGAPPVFVFCNHWWQLLDRISEKEVADRMREFATNILQLWDRDKAEMRQRMLANKDERKIKSLEKQAQKMQNEIQALNKRMVVLNSADENDMPLTGQAMYQSETSKGGSLQASLQHVLEALEKFTSNSLKVYEELLKRIEVDHLAGEHEKVSFV